MKTRAGKPRAERSLATTLALSFLALSVAVLLASAGVQLVSSVRTQQAAVASHQQLIAQGAANTVSNFLQESFRVLETAIWLGDLDATSEAKRRQTLRALLGLQPSFRQLVLVGADGRELSRTSRLSLEAARRLTERLKEETQTQVRQEKRYISEVHIDHVTSEPWVLMAVPVTNVFGDFQGTLMADVNLKFMWDAVDRLKVGETGRAYVVDRRGELIAFGDTARVLKGERVDHLTTVGDFVRKPPAAPAHGVTTYRGILGTTVVGTYAALGRPDWAVVTELPWTEAYRGTIRGAGASLAMTVVMAISAGFLGVYVARRLTVPLVHLTETATRIAGGERDLQAMDRGPKEVASLAVAFNSMTTQLRESLEDLERRFTEQKQAEAALRVSEERLRLALEGTSDGIWDWDIATGEAYFSPRYYTMLGYEPGEFPASYESWRRLLHPDDTPAAENIVRDHVTQRIGAFGAEFRMQAKNGAWRWILSRGTVVEWDREGNAVRVAGSHSDITERKRTEDALRVRTQQLEAIGAVSAEITRELDLATLLDLILKRAMELVGGTGGAILMWDASRQHLVMEACVGDFAAIPRAPIPLGEGIVGRVALTRQGFFVNDYATWEGARPSVRHLAFQAGIAEPLIFRDTLIGVVNIGGVLGERTKFSERDSTLLRLFAVQAAIAIQNARLFTETKQELADRRRAEEALRQANLVVESSPVVLFRWKAAADWPVEYVSENVIQFGYTPQELLSSNTRYASLVHPEVLDRLGQEVEHYTASGVERFQQEYRIIARDGGVRWVDDRTSIERDADGFVTHYQGIVIDITERKRVEVALERAHLLLEAVLDQSPVPMVIASAPDLVVRYANRAAADLLGVSDEPTPVGLPLPEIQRRQSWRDFRLDGTPLAPHDLPLARALRGERIRDEELSVVRKDGTRRWELVSGAPIFSRDGDLVAGLIVFPDITERRQAEDALRASEAFLNTIIEHSPYSTFVADAEGTIVRVNQVLRDTLHIADEDVVGRYNVFRDSQVEAQGLMPLVRRAFDQGETVRFPIRYDGSLLQQRAAKQPTDLILDLTMSPVLDAHNRVVNVIVQHVDITERVRTQEALRVRTRLLEAARAFSEEITQELDLPALLRLISQRAMEPLEAARSIVFLWDDSAGVLLPCAWQGYPDAEMELAQVRLRPGEGVVGTVAERGQGMIVNDYRSSPHAYPPALRHTSVTAALAEPLRYRDRLVGVLLMQHDGEGRRFTVEEQETVRLFASQAAIAIANAQLFDAAQQELGERKRAEERLQASLREKEALLREVHHRVKNNLQVISSLLRLQSRRFKVPEVQEIFRESQNRVRSMALVHELLYQSEDLARVNLTMYFKALTQGLYRAYGADRTRIALVLEVDEVVVSVDVAIPCGLVVGELLSNALKHAFPPGRTGTIRLRAHRLGETDLEIAVVDDGVGLAAERDRDDSATLGLRLVRMLAEDQLRGEVEIRQGNGTACFLRFPMEK